jgi:hypothetical protein
LFKTDTSLHVTGLAPGVKYYLHVRTHCDPGNISGWAALEFYTYGISVNPNPASNTITIRVYGQGNASELLCIYYARGRLIKKVLLSANMATVNMSSWAAGIYNIRYGNDRGYVTRVVKE